ncbi:phosphatase PAP2 family protein [Xanthomonas massiliensis]|uniref:phosphatase PAP2 family protein n=1 Tax=Xanthomonas massiliensis TaxID=1720302 RepID=UPI00098F825B|nr:phosphatase PAP2 family protein [Xanthomonas massiliensis]
MSIPVPAALPACPPRASSHLLACQLLLPWLVGLPVLALLLNGGDPWLADHLFHAEGGRWALRDAWFTTHLVHRDGKYLSTLAGGVAAGLFAASWRWPALRPWRRALGYAVAAVVLSTLAVSVLKHLTGMDCPWDLQRYGGTRPLLGLFQARPAGLPPPTECFPAGHASAGYAWMSLYFAALLARPRWRWAGLAAGIGLGLLFGFSQQLRGAHFLSHDVATALVCWTLAAALYWAWSRPARRASP